MPTLVKTDARGRVTLHKALRIALNISSGDRLIFSQLNDGTVILSPKGVSLPETAHIVTKLGHPDNQVRENPIELPIT
ncbi:AbrB/MazE/SpoVT family DNA-binding domain-containing protein [Oxalobacteraceae sp. CFBP 13730]|nr:AbrB/MazE/SpoVT family DNA-binding domain-containing protein [Oxalobacteraceae sp. CFBP 13730]